MASDAGAIFDEHGGDAMEIAELLVREQATTARLRAELDEARRERAGMQHLAQKNRAALEQLRSAVTALADELDEARYPAGVEWLHAFAARLRKTVGVVPGS